VAALVYRHAQHTINVFIVPATGAADAAPRSASLHGFHTIRWVEDGMAYWAVSDVEPAQLEKLRILLK
jgi:anti-sigma factor RsiW